MSGKRPKILVVDDEVGIRELLTEILTDEGYTVLTAADAESAWDVRLHEKLSLILLDIWMPGKDGLTLLKQWADAGLGGVPIIVMSGHAAIDTAVAAMKMGAQEVLEKPIAAHRLLSALQKAIKIGNEAGSPEIQRTNFGKSKVMQQFKQNLLDASADLRPVLMVGSPGAGASFYAQLLAAPRAPIVFIDSAAQLGGGIDKILREAGGGLIIVRMIDMLNPVQQSGLLALVRESVRVDARVVVGSVESPEVLENDKGFNKTLLAVLSGHVIYQPVLASYMEDLRCTADIIARRLTEGTGLAGRVLTAEAVDLLAGHKFEDDFLELLSLVRSALMYATDGTVDANIMRMTINQFGLGMPRIRNGGDIFSIPMRDARAAFEREYLRRLMQVTQGNIQQAVQISGLERTYLYRKLKQQKDEA